MRRRHPDPLRRLADPPGPQDASPAHPPPVGDRRRHCGLAGDARRRRARALPDLRKRGSRRTAAPGPPRRRPQLRAPRRNAGGPAVPRKRPALPAGGARRQRGDAGDASRDDDPRRHPAPAAPGRRRDGWAGSALGRPGACGGDHRGPGAGDRRFAGVGPERRRREGGDMPGNRLIVLKFGGSVLRDESTLRLAVHEIYRWRRRGWRVAAVVSAFAGRTDELLRRATGRPQADPCLNDTLVHHRSRRRPGRGLTHQNANDPWHADTADPHATAALVATGELHSAGLLGLHLDRAGIRAAVLWPMSFDLTAQGPPLDADPVSLDRGRLERALRQHGVVVIPGYVAQDAEGRPVALGRGGSDLTALFIAQALCAEKCRLVKDVDGLYDRDPSLAAPLAACPPVSGGLRDRTGGGAASGTAGDCPHRYATATFADALATDGSIIQHKAVRFAERTG